MKKIQILIIIFLVCIAPILFLVFGGIYGVTRDGTVSAFADISECEAIVERVQTDGMFTPYETASSDKHAKGLSYTAFFGGKYEDSSCSFEVYAYVFADEATAAAYFEQSTGKLGPNPNFSTSIGLFWTRTVVLSGNTAYTVCAPTHCEQEVVKLLAEVFTITIAEDPF